MRSTSWKAAITFALLWLFAAFWIMDIHTDPRLVLGPPFAVALAFGLVKIVWEAN